MNRKEMILSMSEEMRRRKTYLAQETVQTLYLGGGTPSVFTSDELHLLLNTVYQNFRLDSDAEITIETNPDDISEGYAKELKQLGFNRMSLGIQSMHNHELRLLNRRHDAGQAERSVQLARDAGFQNISMDLIYGLPGSDVKSWKYSLEKVKQWPVQHISAYHLGIEPGTLFHKWKAAGKIKVIDEENSVEQYNILIDTLNQEGFIHYEISSFAKEGYLSRHNTAYWQQKKYLGIGPSAHSFNGQSREWNISSNGTYIEKISSGESPSVVEVLGPEEMFHEYLITGLRTMWGIDLEFIENQFGRERMEKIKKRAEKIDPAWLKPVEKRLVLNDKGMFMSDWVMTCLVQ